MNVYKYKIPFVPNPKIKLPRHSKFLTVENQENNIVAYFAVDPLEKDEATVQFYIVATGEELPSEKGFQYIKTISLHNGRVMLHVFLEREEARFMLGGDPHA